MRINSSPTKNSKISKSISAMLLVFVCFASVNVQAGTPEKIKYWLEKLKEYQLLSSTRKYYENYQDVAERYRQYVNKKRKKVYSFSIEAEPDSAYDLAKPLDYLDTSKLQDNWINKTQLDNAFISARDSQFITWKNKMVSYKRRPTWMFPYDGCHVRAEQVKNKFNEFDFPDFKKVFVFGDLKFNTSNSLIGKSQWWFHVAITAKVNDIVYVIDPAINPSKVLTIEDWANQLGPIDELTFSICEKDTFIPFDNCINPKPVDPQEFAKTQTSYLVLEWLNILTLKRNPLLELQEHPPWRKQLFAPNKSSRGQVGQVYMNYNETSEEIEYFELVKTNLWGFYGKFPTNQQDNENWRYLGSQLESPYLRKLKSLENYMGRYNIGDIFTNSNQTTGETEYFMLASFDSNNSVVELPINQKDSRYWKYLGNDYPIQLKVTDETVKLN